MKKHSQKASNLSGLLFPVVLILLMTFFNAQIWLGQASVPRILEVNRAISQQQAVVKKLQERNSHLFQQIQSLKGGQEELEARARLELGMIKQGEIFYEFAPSTSTSVSS